MSKFMHWPGPWTSLRARLAIWLALSVLLTAALQGALVWRSAHAEAQLLFDAQMQRMALSLTGRLGSAVLSDQALDDAAAEQDLIIQIWRADGLMLYRSPSRLLLPPQSVIGFSQTQLGRVAYRVYALQTPTQVIQVAQALSARRQAATRLALRAILPVLALAPLLALLVWAVLAHAFSPVRRLQRELSGRKPGDLQPLGTAGLPSELRPLVDEFNQLLARLSQAWQAMDRFTADAAHELRTPLAAISLQVQGLERAQGLQERDLALQRLRSGVDRATNLLQQLLDLARQDGEQEQTTLMPLDLSVLVRAAATRQYSAAEAEQIKLQLDAAAPIFILGHGQALDIALDNLLRNALRYTPPGTVIRLSAAERDQRAVLTVEDSGPGIDAAERERIAERFYRPPGSKGLGSGLGLAIVQTVARRHQASMRVDQSPSLGGARVSLSFPQAAAGSAAPPLQSRHA